MTSPFEQATYKTVSAADSSLRIGAVVKTYPMGRWSGGLAYITELAPDPNAPEIVFNVKRIADGAEIGVFEDEVVGVTPHRITFRR